MGILSKLMNTVGPFLGISTPESIATTGDSNLKPRSPRIQILPLSGAYFKCRVPEWGQPCSIANLSTEGVGLLRSTLPPEWPDVGSLAHGDIFLREQLYPVVVKVVHISPQLVGCRFDMDLSQLQLAIHKYFELELGSLSMSQVKSNLLQEQPDGTPHWFKGRNNCELYYVEKDDKVVRFHISFFGNYIEADRPGSLRYGYIVEDENTEKAKHKGSSLIHYVSKLSPDILDAALRFVTNVPGLKGEHRNAVFEILKS